MNPMNWLFEAGSQDRERFIEQIVSQFDRKIRELVNAQYASSVAQATPTEYIVLRVDYTSTVTAKGEASNGDRKYEYAGSLCNEKLTEIVQTLANNTSFYDQQRSAYSQYNYSYQSSVVYNSSVHIESFRNFVSAHSKSRRELISPAIVDRVTNYRTKEYREYVHGEQRSHMNFGANLFQYGNYRNSYHPGTTTECREVQLNTVPLGSFFYYLPIADSKTAKEGDTLLVSWLRPTLSFPVTAGYNTYNCTIAAQIPGPVTLYNIKDPNSPYKDEQSLIQLREQIAKGKLSLQKLLE